MTDVSSPGGDLADLATLSSCAYGNLVAIDAVKQTAEKESR